jgi:hypothetical protein
MPFRTGITICVAKLLKVMVGDVTALSTYSAEDLLGGVLGATGLGRRAARNAGGLNCGIFAPSLVVIAHVPIHEPGSMISRFERLWHRHEQSS